MIDITPILCRAGSMDNYAYLITDKESKISAIIDPSEVSPIVKICQEKKITPQYILNTHHHFDHTDGNLELKKLYNAKVVGYEKDSSRIRGIDINLKEGESFHLGSSKSQIISVDGHTIGHILYYFGDSKALFTGDMLFNLCIGGIFEGTPEQMWNSVQKIKSLPADTMFYPGHEYTMHAAREALYFASNTKEIQKYLQTAQNRLEQGLPAGPFTLAEEMCCNPYLSAANYEEFLQRLNY